jgi:hypothetical protein
VTHVDPADPTGLFKEKIAARLKTEQELHQDPRRPALDTQVGGDHYRKMGIQPIEYIFRNGLGFAEGNVVKYVTRWKDKGGVEDLRKARHYLDLLIESIK